MNTPRGFRYASTYAGIRKVAKDDVALIFSDQPAAAAAVFTTNRVVAGPVTIARKNLRSSAGSMRAILANAGNANCATRTAEQVAVECVNSAADVLNIKPNEVLPASTGVIGVELDSALILRVLPKLHSELDAERFTHAAAAIMTTDTRLKTAYVSVGGAHIAGMCKGSGMIHPRMATTLAFVMTDAAVSRSALQLALSNATGRTFNRISVDGDTSTNDTVAVLANGASNVRPPRKAFEEALTEVLESLAIQIVHDGEGARKLVTIDVAGAPSDAAAEKIARAIANSPLVKTAIAGSDPNWGRILSAAGNAGVVFDPRETDIDMQGMPVCRGGLAADFSEDGLKQKLDAPDCTIRLSIRGRGKGSARFWTCDLTEEYIRINASYRT
ncbi:MAG: bifunctional glutamate N-acetyltransferase/amino-acid acetyltransferase ArgJ [Bryobacterales bacterium]|nr:bifunctional glutamate N-acetyltransferase/amino-acid acetyltransferase ArgJ [Bryobacterales bacterium]MBV9399296.1 bifunctional glutamate N-acetyltransferase/amino-acid acetyltransferase ArgJ [Bryobacterales bacterium]